MSGAYFMVERIAASIRPRFHHILGLATNSFQELLKRDDEKKVWKQVVPVQQGKEGLLSLERSLLKGFLTIE